MRIYGKGGFTLVEILVAVVIASMVLGVLYGALHAGFRAWRAMDRDDDPKYLAMELLRQLSVDLRSAYSPPATTTGTFSFIGVPTQLGEQRFDRLSFVRPQRRVDETGRTLVRVAYFVDSRAESPTLFCVEGDVSTDWLPEDFTDERFDVGQTSFESDEELKLVPICSGVLDFRVSYFNGTEWVDEWSSSRTLPEAISLSITLEGMDVPVSSVVQIPALADLKRRGLMTTARAKGTEESTQEGEEESSSSPAQTPSESGTGSTTTPEEPTIKPKREILWPPPPPGWYPPRPRRR